MLINILLLVSLCVLSGVIGHNLAWFRYSRILLEGNKKCRRCRHTMKMWMDRADKGWW